MFTLQLHAVPTSSPRYAPKVGWHRARCGLPVPSSVSLWMKADKFIQTECPVLALAAEEMRPGGGSQRSSNLISFWSHLRDSEWTCGCCTYIWLVLTAVHESGSIHCFTISQIWAEKKVFAGKKSANKFKSEQFKCLFMSLIPVIHLLNHWFTFWITVFSWWGFWI